MLSKILEVSQDILIKGSQKFADKIEGDRSPSPHPSCTSADLPAMSQSDLHTMNSQSLGKNPTDCSMDLETRRSDSPPTLSSGPSSSSSVTKDQCLPKFRRVDRQWDSTEQKFVAMEPATESGHHDAAQTEDYIFVVRRDLTCNKSHIKTTVEIKDRLLKKGLQSFMGTISGVNFAEENPVIDPKTLFL